ncbi:MAG: ASCH domain-containing protein [Opitutaceae bacterium]
MIKELPPEALSFWSAFLLQSGRPIETRPFEIFAFDDNEESSDHLAALVLEGKKSATASLLWEYDFPDKRPPLVGDLSIVTNWARKPLCVIETTRIRIRPFEEVDEAFAAAEGEGDSTLRQWREDHWAYFGRVCARLGREKSRTMPVVCERFKVVYVPGRTGLAGGT